jgi:hypothetical protein
MSSDPPWDLFGDETSRSSAALPAPLPAGAPASPARQRQLLEALFAFLRAHGSGCEEELGSSPAGRPLADCLGTLSSLAARLLALRDGGDGAAPLWAQLRAAACAGAAAAWRQLRAPGGWPHVAWREGLVMCELGAAVGALAGGGAAADAMRAVDLALIMGAPASALRGVAALAEGCARRSFAAEGGGCGAPLPFLPAVLGVGATFAPFPPPAAGGGAVPRFVVEGGGGALEELEEEAAEDAEAASAAVAAAAAEAAAAGAEHPALAAARAAGPRLSPAAFLSQHVRPRAPAVLSGALDGWRALNLWRSCDWWRARWGHRTVPLEVGAPATGGWREEPHTVRDFVERFLSGGSGAREVAYLAQHELFAQLPELWRDFSVPAVLPAAPGSVNIWWGTAGTVTRLHFDTYDNLLCQVAGYKWVRLFPPGTAPALYVLPPTGTAAQGNVSAVDVEAPDARAHPLFATARGVDAVLGPGDALFIPAGWWHWVRSLCPSLSVNFFFDAEGL